MSMLERRSSPRRHTTIIPSDLPHAIRWTSSGDGRGGEGGGGAGEAEEIQCPESWARRCWGGAEEGAMGARGQAVQRSPLSKCLVGCDLSYGRYPDEEGAAACLLACWRIGGQQVIGESGRDGGRWDGGHLTHSLIPPPPNPSSLQEHQIHQPTSSTSPAGITTIPLARPNHDVLLHQDPKAQSSTPLPRPGRTVRGGALCDARMLGTAPGRQDEHGQLLPGCTRSRTVHGEQRGGKEG